MNILLLASHSVAEYDDIRMFTDLGYDVFCPGGYQDPSRPGESLRPALPDAPYHPDLIEACEEVRFVQGRGDPGPYIDWAKAKLHGSLIDWADVIICHHFPERWIVDQWSRIGHKRVVWRTCGQSDPRLEGVMGTLRQWTNLQIVRYSPAERRAFEPMGVFAGEDALIRFGKYPDDYGPWIGNTRAVGNITQNMRQRGDACGYPFWASATAELPAMPAGPGSNVLPDGIGELSYSGMLEYLRQIRCYLYTGTRPASYTLGLIEAMLSGVPTITIGARTWGASWGGSRLFEAATDADLAHPDPTATHILPLDAQFDDPEAAALELRWLLDYDDKAAAVSAGVRRRAIELFDVATVGQQWVDFLGQP